MDAHFVHGSFDTLRRQSGHEMQLFSDPAFSGAMAGFVGASEEMLFCTESSTPVETTGSVCTYDFGVIYLLDDQKRALSNSLSNFNAVVGPLPYLSEAEHPGHRSLISTSTTCKSIADLPDAPSLISGAFDPLDNDGKGFEDFLSCPSCHMGFRSVTQLKAHRRIHEGEKPFSCQVCHQSFATKPSLIDHVLTHNTLDKVYPCPVCKEVLPRPGMLKKHMEMHRFAQAVATGSPQTPREGTNMNTPPPVALSIAGLDMGRSHPVVRPPLAQSTMNGTKTTPDAAARGATPAGPILGSDPLLVDVHKPKRGEDNSDSEEEDPLECIDPSIPFNASADEALRGAANGEFGKKPFVCKVCGKIFTQSGNLSRHRLVHSQEKPFQCNVCQKRFSQKSHLKTHQNVHSGERAFQCQICEKRFSQLGHLKTHLNVHRRTAETVPPGHAAVASGLTTGAAGARMVVRPSSTGVNHVAGMSAVPVVQLFPPAVHANPLAASSAPAYASSSLPSLAAAAAAAAAAAGSSAS